MGRKSIEIPKEYPSNTNEKKEPVKKQETGFPDLSGFDQQSEKMIEKSDQINKKFLLSEPSKKDEELDLELEKLAKEDIIDRSNRAIEWLTLVPPRSSKELQLVMELNQEIKRGLTKDTSQEAKLAFEKLGEAENLALNNVFQRVKTSGGQDLNKEIEQRANGAVQWLNKYVPETVEDLEPAMNLYQELREGITNDTSKEAKEAFNKLKQSLDTALKVLERSEEQPITPNIPQELELKSESQISQNISNQPTTKGAFMEGLQTAWNKLAFWKKAEVKTEPKTKEITQEAIQTYQTLEKNWNTARENLVKAMRAPKKNLLLLGDLNNQFKQFYAQMEQMEKEYGNEIKQYQKIIPIIQQVLKNNK